MDHSESLNHNHSELQSDFCNLIMLSMLSNAFFSKPFCITAVSVYIIPAAERSINLAENA